MEDTKNILKNWKFWIVVLVVILLIISIVIFTSRNKMSPEETVSKFMYLVENKQFEEAKKLCDGKQEHLDLLSNVKPNDLTFEYSDDKKNAKAVLLEEEIETTNLNVEMKNTILGWKIKKYEVITDLIPPQEIEDRLKAGKSVPDIQLLYWGESDVASKDEITEYATSNEMVAMIFSEMMKQEKYDKANELYERISEQDLTVEQLKEYNWSNYEIMDTFKIMEGGKEGLYFSSTTVKLDNKKIWIYIAGKSIMSIKEATI